MVPVGLRMCKFGWRRKGVVIFQRCNAGRAARWLAAEHKVSASDALIRKTLPKLNLTLKRSLRAGEQDCKDVAEARAESRKQQPELDPGKLVLIDETWTKTNMMRLEGRAERGKRLVGAVPEEADFDVHRRLAAGWHDRARHARGRDQRRDVPRLRRADPCQGSGHRSDGQVEGWESTMRWTPIVRQSEPSFKV
jgi:hypothetical protein